ncbi:hypothetical protein SprV_0501964100 [Sparganum proliferum]
MANSPTASEETSSELAQRLDNPPLAAAANENPSVENRWCQLRDTVQSTALAVLGRARRQLQDWFDGNDATISNLLAEKNSLHKAYVDRPTNDNTAAFYRSRLLVQQWLREMQDAWSARKVEEIQGTFQVPNRLTGHLRINCTTRNTPAVVPPSTSSSSSTPSTNSDSPPGSLIPPSSSSSSNASTSTAVVSAMRIKPTNNPDTPTNTNTTIADTRGVDLDHTCPHCDRPFTSHIGLVSNLRICRLETGEPVLGAPTYTRRTRLHCLHCPHTFMHRMGLFGHTRSHESGTDRSPDTPSTSSTPIMSSPSLTPSPLAPTAISPITPGAHCTSTTPCSSVRPPTPSSP